MAVQMKEIQVIPVQRNDYTMEQKAKEEWDKKHFGDSNPYEELPKMNIFTYHLEKYITGFMDVEKIKELMAKL